MDTEINTNNILGHIVGLNNYTKIDFFNIWNKTILSKKVIIIDLDKITDKIVYDETMDLLSRKFEELSSNLKDLKINQLKIKDLEKKMNQYWKAKMEYYLNKKMKSISSNKQILLIGHSSYPANHKIYINFNIINKYYVKVNYDNHTENIIMHNLDTFRDDIIKGTYNLDNLNKLYLIKKRLNIYAVYKKYNYFLLPLDTIISSIEINSQINNDKLILYLCSSHKYDKKIPIYNKLDDNYGTAYINQWLALSSAHLGNNLFLSIIKGIKNNKSYVKLTNDDINNMNKSFYLYEITDTYDFIAYPSKQEIYKYLTCKKIKYNRMIEIKNLLNELSNNNVDIINV